MGERYFSLLPVPHPGRTRSSVIRLGWSRGAFGNLQGGGVVIQMYSLIHLAAGPQKLSESRKTPRPKTPGGGEAGVCSAALLSQAGRALNFLWIQIHASHQAKALSPEIFLTCQLTGPGCGRTAGTTSLHRCTTSPGWLLVLGWNQGRPAKCVVKVVVQFAFMEEEAGFSCFRSAKPSFVTDTAVNRCTFFFFPPEIQSKCF